MDGINLRIGVKAKQIHFTGIMQKGKGLPNESSGWLTAPADLRRVCRA